MTEVSKVQAGQVAAGKQLTEAEKQQKEQDLLANLKKEPVIQTNPDSGVKGMAVESSDKKQLTPEEKAEKEQTKKSENDEVARMKEESAKLQQQKAEQPKEGPVRPEIDEKYRKYFNNSTDKLREIYGKSKNNPEKQEAIKQILDYRAELARVSEKPFTLSVNDEIANDHNFRDKETAEFKFANKVAEYIAKSNTEKVEDEKSDELTKYKEKADKRLENVKEHQAYLTRKEYKAAMKEAKEEDGISRKEFKKHHSYIKSKKVREFVKANFMQKDENGNPTGEIDMQKWKDHNFQYTGADFKLNYGIDRKNHKGALAGHELDQVKQDHDFKSKRQVKQLMKNAGFEVEKSDKGKKIALAGLGGFIPGGIIGAGVGALLGLAGEVTAEASAQVINKATGEIIASAHDVAKAALTTPGMVIGGVAGAVAAGVLNMINTAMTYHYDGQRDLLNGNSLGNILNVQDKDGNLRENYKDMIIKDFTNGLEGDDLKHGQLAAASVIGLIEGGIPPKSIENALRVARGNTSGEHLNLEEMAKAVEALKAMAENGEELLDVEKCHEGEEPPVADKPVEDKPVEDKPVEDKPVEDKPVEDKPIEDKPIEEKPVEDKPVEDKPIEDKPVEEKERFKDGKSNQEETVTVKNGESFRALAKKYGVSVEDIKRLNQDKIHSFTDCNGKKHTFFRVGAKIILPAGANQDAVEENQKVDAKVEISKYTKEVTSDKNIKKLVDEDCVKKAQAQGDQVYKLYQNAKSEIWNLIQTLKSQVLTAEGREKAEARFRELTGKEPPKPEVLAQAPTRAADFPLWVEQVKLFDWTTVLEKVMKPEKTE